MTTLDASRRGTRGGLAAFHRQRPDWMPVPGDDGIEEARIAVPLDYADPDGERIEIAVSRRRADDQSDRRGTLVAVNGGPGGYFGLGRRFPAVLGRTPLGRHLDLIGIDPRGTGASTPLRAEITAVRAPSDSRPGPEAFEVITDDARRREDGARRAGGAMRRHVHTRNLARDLDVLRAVLGEESIDFLGYTYGTYLGAVYGVMFGSRLRRTVLDSCVHPDWSWREQLMAQGPANLANVEAWAAWVAERNTSFGLGRSRGEVFAAVEEAVARLDDAAETRLRTLLDQALGSRSADRSRWAELAGLVADVRAGGPNAAATGLADERLWPPAETEGETRCGVLDAVTLEKDWPTDLEVYAADMRRYTELYPYGCGVQRAQPWSGTFRSFVPPEPPTPITGPAPTRGLVVRSDGDPIDHPDGAAAMARRLGHRLVTVLDSGEHEIYAFSANPGVDAVVERYLLDGVLPDTDVCVPGTRTRPDVPADPRPAGGAS
jgi:pimeloyl-ACP methyl ester carboxylesterase